MTRAESDYPTGDGHPGCLKCKGRGVVPVPESELPRFALPGATRFCGCVRERDLLDNLKRGWGTTLVESPSAVSSPLMGKQTRNVWLRCPLPDLKAHLRCVAMKQSPQWPFRVITDADLMTTWLYSADEVHDADVEVARQRGQNTHSRIGDLVEPWDLLIIRLGVKAARNQALPEVFLEALYYRDHLGLPTWVVDSVAKPFRQEHRAWSDVAQEHLVENFEFIEIDPGAAEPTPRTEIPARYTTTGFDETPEEEDQDDLLDEGGHVKIKKRDWRNS